MYDYKCTKCGTLFEELVFSSSEADIKVKCPKCDYPDVKRQLSAPFIALSSTFDPACEKQVCKTPVGFT